MPRFDLSQGDQLKRYLDDGIKEGVKNGLLSAATRLVGVIQNEIIPAEKPAPIFDAHYKAAWHAEPTERGADVYNDMPYASVIEHGARAENIKIGRKMIDALAEWARRKGVTGHANQSSPEAHIDARQVAWAIARKMQGTAASPGTGIFNRDGKQGLGILKKGVARLAGFVEEEVRREVKRAMGK